MLFILLTTNPCQFTPTRKRFLDLVLRYLSMPGMSSRLKKLLEECVTCAHFKPSNIKPAGLINLLQHSSGPWSSLTVDLITSLPLCDSHGSIMVVEDHFNMTEFFPCSTAFSAKNTAHIFIQEIFSRHGLPKGIISDRCPQFIFKLWNHFLKGLEINYCLSYGYHTQSDGQTERVNLILEI